jgi:hypothetical protein
MFQFPGLPPYTLCIQVSVIRHDSDGVAPFGFLRIKAYLQLPVVFRRLSRPSSAAHTKAFSVRSW